MKTIAIANLKGGVGKSTTAVALAHHVAGAGHSTLLLDFDAQGSASALLGVQDEKGARGKAIARADRSLRDLIVTTPYDRLSVLPASFSLRRLPELLAETGGDALGKAIGRVAKGYARVVVDAPAGLTIESEAILRVADLILAPIVPSPLAVASFERFATFVADRAPAATLVAFLNQVDRRRAIHRAALDELPKRIASLLPVYVPAAAVVERAAERRVPIGAMPGGGAARLAFAELGAHVEEILGRAAPSPRKKKR